MAYGLSLSIVARNNGKRRIRSMALTNECSDQRHAVYDALSAKHPEVRNLLNLVEHDGEGGGVEIPFECFTNLDLADAIQMANGVQVSQSTFLHLTEALADIKSIENSAVTERMLFLELC
ncbi:hypothetical protein AB4Z40_32960 [Bosea sp. 2YAB26]|uniref:hypothetical protein n=1 Tax=Bosea sp. 2YAB26 TaxID=3237478 RepID=UPI003F93976D